MSRDAAPRNPLTILKRVARALGPVAIAVSVVLGLTVAASSAAVTNGFEPDPTLNTYDSEGTLSAKCPEGIAGTPGSDPAAKELVAGQPVANFESGGTVKFVYHDNPNTDSPNFALQDCVVSYPASKFSAGDFDSTTGVLINPLKKSQLTKDDTLLDAVTLTGVTKSTGDIFYSWTAQSPLTAGTWVCNFARDVADGHGGGGNRKVSPTCYQVKARVTPAAATHDVKTTCGNVDTYTITATPNVTYKVDGTTTAAGTYNLAAGASVTITAHTADPYYFPAGTTTSWGPFTGSVIETCAGGATPLDASYNPTTVCGAKDTYVVPSAQDVVYSVNNVVTAAGIYDLDPGVTVTITAAAAPGKTLGTGATTSWGPYTGTPIEDCSVRPAAATYSPTTACGERDTYTITATPNVVYSVNGDVTDAGTYEIDPNEVVTITAAAAAGYVIADGAETSWGPFTGSAIETCGGGGGVGASATSVTPAQPRHVERDSCEVLDSYTVPTTTGVVYQIGGQTVDAGTYDLDDGDSVTIVAVVQFGYVLVPGAASSWTFTGSEVDDCPAPVLAFTPEPEETTPPDPRPAVAEPEVAEAVVETPRPMLPYTGAASTTGLTQIALGAFGLGAVLVSISRRKLAKA